MILGKKNVTQQGLKTSQGSEVRLTMMWHSLLVRKEYHPVQGGIHVYFTCMSYFTYDVYVT